jgi:urease accessory protein UreE
MQVHDLALTESGLIVYRFDAPLRELLTATGLVKRLQEKHIHPSARAAVAAYHAQFGA